MFLDDQAEQLANLLRVKKYRIVFAESCTAGLISASMGRIPGVSSVLAGSSVVYQVPTKVQWLNVSSESIDSDGVVSRLVSEQMATGVLDATPHANISASVTGHLGPGAPEHEDGIAWSAVCCRDSTGVSVVAKRLHLLPDSGAGDDVEVRRDRQFDAARQVMEFCIQVLGTQEQAASL